MTVWCVLIRPRDRPAPVEPQLAALARDPTWRSQLIGNRFLVLTCGRVAVAPLADGDGLVLGEVFARSAGDLASAVRWPSGDDGRELVRRYWGRFVALRAAGAATEILRDPSALAPCYRIKAGDASLITNAPRLLADQGLLQVAIDWEVLIDSLVNPDARDERTALIGVSELPSGTLVRLEPTRETRHRVWTAWDHIAKPGQAAPAPDQLAATLDRCAGAWARVYRRPLIEISGGFDSAVVAAAFAPHVERLQLITFAAGVGDPNELGYARAIADYFGVPLEIARPEVDAVDLTVSHARDLPRPNARAFTQAADALSAAYAWAIGADAFLSGGGGDDLFGYRQSVAPAFDRLAREGISMGVLHTLDDIARTNQATLWEALGRFVRALGARGAPPLPRRDTRLLGSAALDRARRSITPEPAPARALPGAAAHVRAIESLANHLEGHSRAAVAPVLFPLLSQPLVEYCIGVPSWEWYRGGINRALARRAFERRLPPAVIERRSKGAFDGFCARLFEHQRPLIAELLLDGHLAREAIIDPVAVAAALKNPSPSGPLVMRLLALVDREAWLRCWIDGMPRERRARASA